MPALTYDGRSFLLSGRRFWIVSGGVHYARIPRELWRDRIHAAKLAGLNTIETPVFWSLHEPVQGQFNFKGEADLRHFVQLVQREGMYVILRPGPFVGMGWDFGGLPTWMAHQPSGTLRTANIQFLESCSRYLAAVAEQVRDLQITSPGKGGPIILVQNEMGWTCGDDTLANGYLRELGRYLRESGFSVPLINANNLWQGVEGEIDCWAGNEDMLSTMRQLSSVRPDRPRLVIDFRVAPPTVWGEAQPAALTPAAVARRLAEILAGGGQFNISPFVSGTNFGTSGGRLPGASGAFVTMIGEPSAPVTQTGAAAPSYNAVRRVATFASQFSKVLAHLDPSGGSAVVDPASLGSSKSTRRRSDGEPVAASVVHARGTQGSIAFVFGPEPASSNEVGILLPDGQPITVPLGVHGVAWCLMDAPLGGRATLDYSTLSVLGMVGTTLLVCFGPAGSEGQISINGSPITVTVPKGKEPSIHEHEGVHLVIASDEQVDNLYLAPDAAYVGVAGLTADHAPIFLPNSTVCVRIDARGSAHKVHAGADSRTRLYEAKIDHTPWLFAEMTDYAAGTNARYAAIDGPMYLANLGAPVNYGWYRVTLKSGAAKRVKVRTPEGGDRLHFFVDGQYAGASGRGIGTAESVGVPLKKGETSVVVLADNLGRVGGGFSLGERKGLYGHLWEFSALRTGKPTIEASEPVEILRSFAPLWEVCTGDMTLPHRITWKITHRKKCPLFLTIREFPCRALLLVNETAHRALDVGATSTLRFEAEELKKGVNLFQIALFPEQVSGDGSPVTAESALAGVSGSIGFHEGDGNLSEKADWAFARWEPPAPSSFSTQGRLSATPSTIPTWWKCTFGAGDPNTPIRLDLSGLTKGQIYVNQRHLGRYFVGDPTGKPVPPQHEYYVPESWLHADEPNELLVFDEHGASPTRVKFISDHHDIPLKA